MRRCELGCVKHMCIQEGNLALRRVYIHFCSEIKSHAEIRGILVMFPDCKMPMVQCFIPGSAKCSPFSQTFQKSRGGGVRGRHPKIIFPQTA